MLTELSQQTLGSTSICSTLWSILILLTWTFITATSRKCRRSPCLLDFGPQIHELHVQPLHNLSGPRLFRAAVGPFYYVATTRTCHIATGKFTNLESDGKLATKQVSIRVGDPGQTYVLIPTEVGFAVQASSCLAKTSSAALPEHPDRLALKYFHDTQHFALGNSPSSGAWSLLIS